MKLVLFGGIPILVGYVYNLVIANASVPWMSLGFLFLVLWGGLGYIVSSLDKKPLIQAFKLCLIGIIMIIMTSFQSIVSGGYFFNILGSMPQYYFLPIAQLTMRITNNFTDSRLIIFVIEWIVLFAISYIGCYLKLAIIQLK